MENKSNWKNLDFKSKLSYILCIASFIIGVLLTIAGFMVNPLGEVHASILTSLGVFLTFSGSIIGIAQHYGAQLEGFKSEVRKEISKEEDKY